MGFKNDDTATKTKDKAKVKEKKDNGKVLLLHNDDENTFDHVINSLVQICKHTPQKAEESAFVVHTKGKCEVYKGDKSKLTKMMWALQLKGLIASVEDE